MNHLVLKFRAESRFPTFVQVNELEIEQLGDVFEGKDSALALFTSYLLNKKIYSLINPTKPKYFKFASSIGHVRGTAGFLLM